ncbi:MAB_1171c family putative transporter [Micromonospora sp. C97]|uniref:MAB_1171c family putative transporter n=1 Tax=Micromonospora sp. C97 TaxID=2824883 RepID=UPI001B38E9D4|nr:MAB_1171c family putative transporter [Micromonospora sp. C97]
MVNLAHGVMIAVTLVCWGMSLYKLRDLARDRDNRPLRALCLALIAITISMTIQPLMSKIDELSGIPDVTRLLSNCLSLVCATAAQAFLLYMTSRDVSNRRRVRRRTIALALTIAVMIVMFVATLLDGSRSDPRVRATEYDGGPSHPPFQFAYLTYLFVYLAYLGWSLTQVVVLANRYAAIAHRPLLRFGLRMITAGSLWGLAYVAAKLVAIALANRSADWAQITDAVVVLAFSTSILLVLIGSTIPSWGPRVGLDRLWAGAAAARDYYRLYPLWARIHAVLPEIALLPPPSGVRGALSVARDASLRRVRITVEILDGYAALRPWMSASVAAHAQDAAQKGGLLGDQQTAMVEAVVIGAALASRLDGAPPSGEATEAIALPLGPSRDLAAGDVGAADQVTWLAQVARAIESPMAAKIITRATSEALSLDTQSSER